MRPFKLISYLIAALSMSYYRLLRDQAYVTFNNNEVSSNAEDTDMIPYGAKHVWIPAENGDELSAWLVTPKGVFMLQDNPFPIVVMAHGFGNQKDMGLIQYAESFSEIGIAALLIDYRSFGGSSRNNWKIRNYLNPWHHVEDIVASVRYVRSDAFSEDNIDPNSIALWGTAYAGGHVIMAAEALGPDHIRGVVAQAPFLDGRAAAWNTIKRGGVIRAIQFTSLAVTDYLRHMLRLSPLYVKIISDNASDVSYLTVSSEDFAVYSSKHPKKFLGGWENKAPARSMFMLSFYSPMKHIDNVEVM